MLHKNFLIPVETPPSRSVLGRLLSRDLWGIESAKLLKGPEINFPLILFRRVLVARRSFLKVWHFSEPAIPILPARPRT